MVILSFKVTAVIEKLTISDLRIIKMNRLWSDQRGFLTHAAPKLNGII